MYGKSGSLPVACVIRDSETVIENSLYWAVPNSDDEANYLAAILNSETARSRAERYQSRGQFGARHFDKVMFNLPIPPFDPKKATHRALAAAGEEAEQAASAVELVENERFVAARKRVRRALVENGVAGRIEKLVGKLLGPEQAR